MPRRQRRAVIGTGAAADRVDHGAWGWVAPDWGGVAGHLSRAV